MIVIMFLSMKIYTKLIKFIFKKLTIIFSQTKTNYCMTQKLYKKKLNNICCLIVLYDKLFF